MANRPNARGLRFALAVMLGWVAGALPLPAEAQSDPTLSASFGLNEAVGSVSADLSGNGHTATLVNGPIWAEGRYGSALSFDGVNDSVAVSNAATLNFGTSDFTLMMWVKRNALGGSVQRHLFSKCAATARQTGCKELYFNGNTLRFSSVATGNTNAGTIGDTNWHHIAVVFTRSNSRLRIYVDGVLRTTATRNLEPDDASHFVALGSVIGGNSFSGVIDEVRVYSRALTLTQLTADLNTPLQPVADTTPPVLSNPQPTGTLPAGTTQTTLSLISNENAACRYGTTPGTAYAAMSNAFATTGGTAHSTTVTGLSSGQAYTYYARCQDAAGNANPSDLPISFSVAAPDVAPPTVSVTAPTAGATVSGTISLSATASDNVGVAGVQFLVDGANLGAEDTVAPYTLSWNTTTANNGIHTITARARDAAGNQAGSATVSVTVSNAAPDTTPPAVSVTAPTAGVTVSGTITVSAAASDNVGVAGVQFLLDGVNLGTESTTAPFALSWNTATASNGAHSITARARDAAGNQTTSAAVGVTVSNAGPSGLVAAYGFSEGSGSTVADLSGNGNTGTISGAAWTTAGKSGNALVFNGSSSAVTIPNSASLQLTTGMTLAAWVYPTSAPNGWRSIITKNLDHYYLVASSGQGDAPAAGGTWAPGIQNVLGTTALAVNTWTHVAATYDAATLRLYVNGVQVASQAKTGSLLSTTGTLQIGASSYGEYFAGRIDEVRIYNRALTAAELAVDMTTPITPPGPDTSPPSAPTALSALPAGGSQINLSWTASADNVGVSAYAVERCQGAGCTSFVQVLAPTAAAASDTGLVAGTTYSYRVRATDAAGNLSGYSNTATATTPAPDGVPPTAPTGLTASAAGATQVSLGWVASTDNVGVAGYRVERCTGAGCSNFAQVLTPTGTSVVDSGLLAATTYTYRVRAADAAGNLSDYSGSATATTAAAPTTNPIVAENQLPGSAAWQLGGTFGRPYATDAGGEIKGYASAVSVNKGESINFHVTVNPAQTFTIDIYRIGWYQGLGGRLVQQIGPLNGVRQPACPMNASTGLIECGWTASYTLTTQTSWTSGIYLAVLRNAQNFHNYMIFAVRDDSRTGALLYQQPVTTAQAYNDYPKGTGKSLYEHLSSGANTLAGTPRAVKVSFDRPYAGWGDGAFLELSEINFLRWAEKNGYDITYSTNVDTHVDGARLQSHRGFLSLPHDEYWTKSMYDAAVAARDAGVNLAFLGANSVFWQIRFEPSSTGAANRVIVCYKQADLDPVTDPRLKTVQWRDASGPNRPEQALMGIQFTDGPNNGTASYVVTNSSNWMYAGTGFADGDVVPGIVWYESDRQVAGAPLPVTVPGTYTLLSRSPYVGSGNSSDYNNASIYQAPSGAWVFASGTMGWSWGLDNFYPEGGPARADARIQRATSNLLNRFVGR